MTRLQIITDSQTWQNFRTWQKEHQVAKFRAIKQHATETNHGKQRHGMNLLIAYNKNPLLTVSQKGTENMMAPI